MSGKIDQKIIHQFGNLELIAKQVVEGFITGLHKSPFHGFSVEFSEHRLYNTGESIKNIDWKLYGRTDKLFVKRFEEETNLRCQFIIDNSSSMYFPVKEKLDPANPNKILFSVYCTAALMYLLRKQRDASGLSVFSDKLEVHTPAKTNPVHQRLLYHELEKLLVQYDSTDKKSTFATDALHQIADRIHQRSLVVIFSDMFDTGKPKEELFSALQHLKHNKHEVLMFHVTDKSKEVDFNYENRPYRFVDMESGEELKIHPNEVKQNYKTAINDFRQELKFRCSQYHIDLVEADINEGFNHVLLSYLIKREKLL
jgi:uncharacterized protein (DUF58 family)